MRASIFILLTVFSLSSCFLSDELPPDQQTWTYGTPNDVGLSDSEFLFLNDQIKVGDYELIGGLIIVKGNKLIFENYFSDTLNRQSLIPLGQSSIMLTVAAIGIAEDQGLLDTGDSINQYFPMFASAFEADTRKQNITIENLMTNTSGLSWNETVVSRFTINEFNQLVPNEANNLNQMIASNDWIEFLLNRPLEAPPGLRYNFNSGVGIMLSKIIERVSGLTFEDFLLQHLLNPLNVQAVVIENDPSGNPDGARGISISLLDWTKVSYLLIQNGIRDGRRILDPNFIDASTSIQTSVSGNFNFGYGWRLLGENFTNQFSFDKDNVYYVTGETGQDQYIITEESMIITIYAENFFSSRDASFNLFRDIALLIP